MKMRPIDVTVLGEINNGYRLKVSILDDGIYIWSFTARRSDKNNSGWWIQEPAQKIGAKYKRNPEFVKSKPLWQEIEREALEAVQEYEANDALASFPTDEELTDEAIAKGLDQAYLDMNIQDNPKKPRNPFEGLA